MRHQRFRIFIPVSLLAATALLTTGLVQRGAPIGQATAPPDSLVTVKVTEWTVPWEKTRPRDPHMDGDGRVWFVGQSGNYIAYLEPVAGTFRRYEIDPGTHPHNLIVDTAGMVWYAGNRNGMIGRLNPATGAITRYPVPAEVRDPHTLMFDEAGDLWFTAQQAGNIGRLRPSTGKIDVIDVPTPNARTYGIAVAPDGDIWFNEFGVNKLASIDPATLAVTEYVMPNAGSRGRRIEVTSDGMVWYVDYPRGMLGRLDPAKRTFKEWPAPGGAASLPYGMAVDDRDRLWFVESGQRPNRLVGFDPATEKFFSMTEFGGNPSSVRHIYFHQPTRNLWFGTDANTIARAEVP